VIHTAGCCLTVIARTVGCLEGDPVRVDAWPTADVVDHRSDDGFPVRTQHDAALEERRSLPRAIQRDDVVPTGKRGSAREEVELLGSPVVTTGENVSRSVASFLVGRRDGGGAMSSEPRSRLLTAPQRLAARPWRGTQGGSPGQAAAPIGWQVVFFHRVAPCPPRVFPVASSAAGAVSERLARARAKAAIRRTFLEIVVSRLGFEPRTRGLKVPCSDR
jgi:hypothetical protein